jgi:hypothetical protein
MEYLATRFAGFDGAAAITHIFPWLLNVSITQLSSSTLSFSSQSSCQLSTDRHNRDDGRLVSNFGEAARLEALSALVSASSNAQREAYLPVLLPPMAVALSHEKVPLPLQDLCQMLIRFLYFTCASVFTPVATARRTRTHTHTHIHICHVCLRRYFLPPRISPGCLLLTPVATTTYIRRLMSATVRVLCF